MLLINKSIREFISKIKNKNGVFLGYVHFLARERLWDGLPDLGWMRQLAYASC
jgi:hypothetical protein